MKEKELENDIEDIKLVRINVNLEKSVKEWYQLRARKMGMSMSQLMSFVLTSYCESRMDADVRSSFNEFCMNPQNQADNKELLSCLKDILDSV